MKNIIFVCLIMNVLHFYGQAVTINTTNYNASQLVGLLGANSATNTTKSNGNGVGYFQNTNPAFPFSNGIVISTGNANSITGTSNISGTASNVSDANLQFFANSIGLTGNVVDTSYLSYNFTAIDSQLSFDYIFASEEYGQYQCGFTDVVAFLLTDLTTNITTNMAVISGSTTPVSVSNIRNIANNTSCTSANPQYFDVFNSINNPATNGTSFNGRTVVLNASANLVVGNAYKLKLVIGDYQDALYDSAVFLKASPIATNVLGPDLTIANNTAICQGSTNVLSTGLSVANYFFQWYANDVIILGETNSTYTFNQVGVYKLKYKNISTQVEYTDEIIIENKTPLPQFPDVSVCGHYIVGVSPASSYYTGPNGTGDLITPGTVINTSTILYVYNGCENTSFVITIFQALNTAQPQNMVINEENSDGFATFDLSIQIPIVLNGLSPNDFQVSFYNNLLGAMDGVNPITDIFSFSNSSNPQVIYSKVSNLNGSNCTTESSFILSVNNIPTVTFQNFIIYEQSTDGVAVFDLTAQIPTIIGTNSNPANFVVTFFISFEDATNNINPIANSTQFTNTSNPQTIYVRVASTSGRTTTTAVYGTMELSVQEELSAIAFDNAKIVLSPNPVIDFLTIFSKESLNVVTIYNVLGQLVFNKSALSNKEKLDLSTLAAGNYFVKINGNNYITKVLKIVKQ